MDRDRRCPTLDAALDTDRDGGCARLLLQLLRDGPPRDRERDAAVAGPAPPPLLRLPRVPPLDVARLGKRDGGRPALALPGGGGGGGRARVAAPPRDGARRRLLLAGSNRLPSRGGAGGWLEPPPPPNPPEWAHPRGCEHARGARDTERLTSPTPAPPPSPGVVARRVADASLAGVRPRKPLCQGAALRLLAAAPPLVARSCSGTKGSWPVAAERASPAAAAPAPAPAPPRPRPLRPLDEAAAACFPRGHRGSWVMILASGDRAWLSSSSESGTPPA
jgi:hypothetical protein